ncbi:MAG: HAMP domain-containing sensor histidine kinase [Elusimicrobiota bacterium]|jgi:signal transduction histidine kinase
MPESAKLDTHFLPALRENEDAVRKQFEMIADIPNLSRALDQVPDVIAILNSCRQIVYLNRVAVDFIKAHDGIVRLGIRPGEAFRCVHSDAEAGCGISEFCRNCGTPNAVLGAMKDGRAVRECRILQAGGGALDLRVVAGRFDWRHELYTFITFMDISDQKRRRALERIFFHDVINTAGGLQGMLDLFPEMTPEERESRFSMLQRLAAHLVDEILAQRDLAAAESSELSVNLESVDARRLAQEVMEAYRESEAAGGRELRLAPGCPDTRLVTDAKLLRRVIGNMVKNALEACQPGEAATLQWSQKDGIVEFAVHNPGGMPREVQLQMFHRSFSTKDPCRGLGSYSMKLLTERYLGGSIGFSSDDSQGTWFWVGYPCAGPPGPIKK